MRPAFLSGTYAPMTCAMSLRSLTVSKSPGMALSGDPVKVETARRAPSEPAVAVEVFHLAIALGADEHRRANEEECGEQHADDRKVGGHAVEHDLLVFGRPRVVDGAGQVDGVAHRREAREEIEPARQVLQRVEDAGEEDLRQQN